MNVWKGGRGVKAPYETTHVRIPTPIKSKVEELSNTYKNGIELDLVISKDSAINEAKNILRSKKSARESLSRLLTSLYGEEIKL
jgi:hypothetical protein